MLIVSGPDQEASASWSPDGTKLLFHVARSSGNELKIMEQLDDGSSWSSPESLVAVATAGYGAWSPDSDRIAYPDGGVAIISLSGGDPIFLDVLGEEVKGLEWAQDGRSLVVSTGSVRGESSMWSVPLDGGGATHLRTFDDPLRPTPRPASSRVPSPGVRPT